MIALAATLRRIEADLADLGAAYALVGGLAVSARTEPRFTRDVDLVVAVAEDAEAERLIHQLQTRGFRVDATVEQDAIGRLATARLREGADPAVPVIDLLFASSGIEPEVAAAAEPIELLEGFVLPVARVGHLIALKVLARDDVERPQDAADLRALLGVAPPEELARAREALGLIEARGYHRERALLDAFENLLRTR